MIQCELQTSLASVESSAFRKNPCGHQLLQTVILQHVRKVYKVDRSIQMIFNKITIIIFFMWGDRYDEKKKIMIDPVLNMGKIFFLTKSIGSKP